MAIKTALGAQRYNNRMNKIFEEGKRLNEIYGFIRFMEANTHLTLDDGFECYKAMKDIPY